MNGKLSRGTMRKLAGASVAIVAGLGVGLLAPPQGLTVQSMRVMGVIVWAILNWMLQTMPDYVVALAMCALWAGWKAVPFSTAFGAFAGTTWWILIGALGLGVAVSRSGLLRRMSLLALRLFPPTFNGQVLALLGAGTVVAPCIPSTEAKCAIAGPVAMGIADALGLAKRSEGRAGLFCAMYVGFSLNATIFISASFLGYTILGVLPPETQAQFTWTTWLIAMIPWGLLLLAGSYCFITRAYRPKAVVSVPADYVQAEISALGPMTRDECITLGVLAVALVFWVGEAAFGIPVVVTTLLGLGLLFGLGVLGTAELHEKMAWNLLLFIGSVLNLANVLPAAGINAWLGAVLSPVITRFMDNPYLLIVALVAVVYLTRALIASLSGSMTLFTIMLVPFAAAAGINPWVVGITAYVSVMVWYLPYQNANFLSAFAAIGGEEMVSYRSTVKMSCAYMVISLLGLLISVPYWRMLGLVP